jgi:hypothetical protein
MRKRTKAQMAAYQAGRRARIALEKAAAVPPVIELPAPESIVSGPETSMIPPTMALPPTGSPAPTPAAVPPVPCPDCSRLKIALEREQEESARLRDMVKKFLTADEEKAAEVSRLLARIADLETPKEAAKVPAPTPDVPIETRTTAPREDDAQALAARVVAAKVNRINNFGRNPCIGRA